MESPWRRGPYNDDLIVFEMRSSTQRDQSQIQGLAEFSVGCPTAIWRVQVTSQPNAALVGWCGNPHEDGDDRPSAGGGAAVMSGDRGPAADPFPPHGRYKIRTIHGLSFPVRALRFMDTSGKLILGPICSCRENPGAGSHSTPEGWVRPQGVGPRVSHHKYVWAGEGLTARKADPSLIQSLAMSETE